MIPKLTFSGLKGVSKEFLPILNDRNVIPVHQLSFREKHDINKKTTYNFRDKKFVCPNEIRDLYLRYNV